MSIFYVCSTKIGKNSDISKCFEDFVSQALGFLKRFYAAELRLTITVGQNCICNGAVWSWVRQSGGGCLYRTNVGAVSQRMAVGTFAGLGCGCLSAYPA